MSISGKLVRRPISLQSGRLRQGDRHARHGVCESHGGQRKGRAPTAEAFAAMDRFTEELVEAGILVAGAGLKPTAQAKRIVIDGRRPHGHRRAVRREQRVIAGFSIWEVKDMDEAVAWAKRSPNLAAGRSEIEIRPFLEAADLAEFMTPEELASPVTESAGSSASPDTVGCSPPSKSISASPRGEAPRIRLRCGDDHCASTTAASFAMMACTALVGWMPSQNRNSSGRSSGERCDAGRHTGGRHICQTKCVRRAHDVLEEPERIEPHDPDSRKQLTAARRHRRELR